MRIRNLLTSDQRRELRRSRLSLESLEQRLLLAAVMNVRDSDGDPDDSLVSYGRVVVGGEAVPEPVAICGRNEDAVTRAASLVGRDGRPTSVRR